MKILGITLTYNEEKMIPYVMPYYMHMGIDKLIVYDNGSTDNTVKELSKYPFVEIRHFDTDGTLNDDVHIKIKNNVWKEYRDEYDWCICSDFDEVLYTDRDIREVLHEHELQGETMFIQTMLNLVSENFPNQKELVHKYIKNGALWKDYDTNIAWGKKCLLFNLKEINEMNYTWGCHNENPEGNAVPFNKGISAFHLKYIDFQTCFDKCKNKKLRLSEFNKENELGVNDQPTEYVEMRRMYNDIYAHLMDTEEFMSWYDNLYYVFQDENEKKFLHKDYYDKDKYVVCVCAKNENDYIREWVEHYLSYGFDKIFICDNNNDESLLHVLEDYIKNGTVEIFDFRNSNSFQVQFYSYFCEEGNYKWCGYFDADEFLEIHAVHDIKQYLENKTDDCISFNWVVYGSNGEKHYNDKPIQKRFTQPMRPINMFKENCFVKSIVRGGKNRFNCCHFNGSHIPTSNSPQLKYSLGGYMPMKHIMHQQYPPRYKEGYIKHYYTKSFDEWINKSQRGWPDGTPTLTTANFFLTETPISLPIENYTNGYFIAKSNEIAEKYRKEMELFDVIQVFNPSRFVYAFIVNIMTLMKTYTDHTFVLNGEDDIDDALFTMLMEYAIETGNKLVYIEDKNDIWNIFLQNTKKIDSTYYIISF